MNKKCHKHPDHSEELKRLNRLSGQIEGIKKMIEQGRYCVDIMTQLKAVQSASKAIEINILKRHFEACVTEALSQKSKAKRDAKIDELMKLFRKNS